MYPHESAYRKVPDGVSSQMLDVMALGPCAAGYLAADKGHFEALQYAALRIATHRDHEKAPRAWRQWSGKLLVRAGRRLEGAASIVEAEVQPATQ